MSRKVRINFISTVDQQSTIVLDLEDKFFDEDGNPDIEEISLDDAIREKVFDNIEFVNEYDSEWKATKI